MTKKSNVMKKVSDLDCKTIIQSQPYVVLKFGATCCPPCISATKAIEALEPAFPQFEFLDVDIDKNEEYTVEMEVISMPAIFFVMNGVFVKNNYGNNLKVADPQLMRDILKEMLEQQFNKSPHLFSGILEGKAQVAMILAKYFN